MNEKIACCKHIGRAGEPLRQHRKYNQASRYALEASFTKKQVRLIPIPGTKSKSMDMQLVLWLYFLIQTFHWPKVDCIWS